MVFDGDKICWDYIIYYSKNKIDMLFEQIEAVTPEKSQGKLGVNLGIINGEISCSEKLNDGYIRKLEVVLEKLKAKN